LSKLYSLSSVGRDIRGSPLERQFSELYSVRRSPRVASRTVIFSTVLGRKRSQIQAIYQCWKEVGRRSDGGKRGRKRSQIQAIYQCWKEVGWSEKGSEKESDPGHLPVLEGGEKGRKRSQVQAIYQCWKKVDSEGTPGPKA
jgi:hypothetical protein